MPSILPLCSYLRVERIVDGQVRNAEGNLNSGITGGVRGILRWYHLTLLSEMAYRITVMPGSSNGAFFPSQIQVAFVDAWDYPVPPCPGNVSLLFTPAQGNMNQWSVVTRQEAFWRSECSSATLAVVKELEIGRETHRPLGY